MDFKDINIRNWVGSIQDSDFWRIPCECGIELPGSISHGISQLVGERNYVTKRVTGTKYSSCLSDLIPSKMLKILYHALFAIQKSHQIIKHQHDLCFFIITFPLALLSLTIQKCSIFFSNLCDFYECLNSIPPQLPQVRDRNRDSKNCLLVREEVTPRVKQPDSENSNQNYYALINIGNYMQQLILIQYSIPFVVILKKPSCCLH